jgi:hypothetical protein
LHRGAARWKLPNNSRSETFEPLPGGDRQKQARVPKNSQFGAREQA